MFKYSLRKTLRSTYHLRRLMDDTLRVRATLAKVSPERFEAFQKLGISSKDFEIFKNYNAEALTRLGALGLETDELLDVAQWEYYSDRLIVTYAELRQRGLETAAIKRLSFHHSVDMLKGLEAGIAIDIINAAFNKKVGIDYLIEADEANITYDDLFEAVESDSQVMLHEYLKARKAGYTHQELMAVLNIRINDRGFKVLSLSEYLKLREVNITHDEVMEATSHYDEEGYSRSYYTDFVTDTDRPLKHKEALELTLARIAPTSYRSVSDVLTQKQIMEGVRLGMTGSALSDHAERLRNNCRITIEESLQFWRVGHKSYVGINSYIKLIDAGFTFEEILAVTESGLGLMDFRSLRDGWQLSQTETLEVGASGVSPNDYMKLRHDGIDHMTIINAAMAH